jgi:hypothetical protein
VAVYATSICLCMERPPVIVYNSAVMVIALNVVAIATDNCTTACHICVLLPLYCYVLSQGSLQTFLNAFTYPDRTCYPVASQNTKVTACTHTISSCSSLICRTVLCSSKLESVLASKLMRSHAVVATAAALGELCATTAHIMQQESNQHTSSTVACIERQAI